MKSEEITKMIEQVSATMGLDFNDETLNATEKKELYEYMLNKMNKNDLKKGTDTNYDDEKQL